MLARPAARPEPEPARFHAAVAPAGPTWAAALAACAIAVAPSGCSEAKTPAASAAWSASAAEPSEPAAASPPEDEPPPLPPPRKEDPDAEADAEPPFEGTAGILDKKRPDGLQARLAAVRTGEHEGYDRVVFEFEGATLPGYHIEYIDKPVRQCGSGNAVDVAGDAFLQLRFSPAVSHDDKGKPTVKARERRLKQRVLRELEQTCDFEGVVVWVLGAAHPGRYRVLELTSPARIVVDVRHPHDR